MGGLVRGLFGGSKSTSAGTSNSLSENQAYGTLLGLLRPGIETGSGALSTLGSILGIGDPAAGKAATKNFMDSTGYQFMLDSGASAIRGNQATKGLFNSGSTGKRLTQFGQELGQTKMNELINQLATLGGLGTSQASVLAGAGQRSESNSTQSSSGSSSNGVFNSLFPGGLSDRRAKNIGETLGELSNGIPVVIFEYKASPGHKFVGVVAQDVERIQPEALGPVVNGMLTVDYSKLEQRADLPPYGSLREAA